MKIFLHILLLYLIFISTFVSTSDVLMLLPIGPLSHKKIFIPLAENLVKKGHSVTLVSCYGPRDNISLPYEDIEANTAFETIKQSTDFDIFRLIREGSKRLAGLKILLRVIQNLSESCEAFIEDPAVQKVWNSKPDLILLPEFMNECGLIFVHKFKVPFIYVATSGIPPFTADLIGLPNNPAYITHRFWPRHAVEGYFERAANSILTMLLPALRRWHILSSLDSLAQRLHNDTSISLAEVEKNVSFVFNFDNVLRTSRPLQPNVINIGSIHCRLSKAIEDSEIKKFLDSSEDQSVVLFSLGSYIRSSAMDDSLRNLFIASFSGVPYKVIWKWEGAPIKDLPSNILLKNWLPQQDILGHRAVAAFFTHGGLLSSQEAIFHSVPMVALPFMTEQSTNADLAAAAGIAICLDIKELTESQIINSLRRVIENKSFSKNMKKWSLLLKDEEITAVDRATYYIEYVLKYDGAKHLRSLPVLPTVMQLILVCTVVTMVLLTFFVCIIFA